MKERKFSNSYLKMQDNNLRSVMKNYLKNVHKIFHNRNLYIKISQQYVFSRRQKRKKYNEC